MADVEWMKPHLDLANRMIKACVVAQTDGALPTDDEFKQWRTEIHRFFTLDDGDLMVKLLEARFPEQLIFILGQITGRESKRRNSGS